MYADPESARASPADGSSTADNSTDAITNANTVANSHYSTAVPTTGCAPGHGRTGSNASSKSRAAGKSHSRNSSTGSAVILTEAHAAATGAAAGAASDDQPPDAADASFDLTRATLANASFVSQDTAWASSAWSDHGTDDVAAAVAAAAYHHPQDELTYQPPSVGSVGADSGVGGGGPASMNSDTFAGMEFTSDTRANSVNSAYQNVAEVDFEDDGVAHYENVANLSRSGGDGGVVLDPYDSDPESRRNSTSLITSADHSPDGYGFDNRSGAATAEPQSEDEGMAEGVDGGDLVGATVAGIIAQANLQPIMKYSAFNTIPAPKISSTVDAAQEYI